MNQKTNKNPRDVHGERKLSKLQDLGIFRLLRRLPTQLQEVPPCLTVASKIDSAQ